MLGLTPAEASSHNRALDILAAESASPARQCALPAANNALNVDSVPNDNASSLSTSNANGRVPILLHFMCAPQTCLSIITAVCNALQQPRVCSRQTIRGHPRVRGEGKTGADHIACSVARPTMYDVFWWMGFNRYSS